jgi:glutamyl/glutaminyl-tRNA synthetase
MTRQEIVAAFTLDRVKSGPAQMDLRKLTHLNQQYLTAMPAAEFAARARAALAGQPWEAGATEPLFGRVCALMQSRATTFLAALEWKHFFVDVPDYEEKAVHKLLRPAGTKAALAAIRQRLADAPFTLSGIEQAIRETETQFGIQQGKLNQPARAAATGSSIGAGLCETLELLGRERTLARLEYSIEHFCG